jgi:alpha-ribazole phosphatase/probable phosphoglycerate mutase
MNQATVIDFLRHGEARGGSYFRGITDDPLTERGWRQMYTQCGESQWDVVVSSPLRRCRSFAAAWCEQQQLDLMIEPAWSEIDFGAWEGQSAEQISSRWPDGLAAFYKDPVTFTPPGAESYQQFAARVRQGWDNLLAAHAGRRILVITHAGVIRALFAEAFNLPVTQSFHIDLPHACLTRFTSFDDDNGRFVQLNFHKPG